MFGCESSVATTALISLISEKCVQLVSIMHGEVIDGDLSLATVIRSGNDTKTNIWSLSTCEGVPWMQV